MQVLKLFGNFELLTTENISFLMDNRVCVQKRIDSISGVPWTKQLAQSVLSVDFPYIPAINHIKSLNLLGHKHVRRCLETDPLLFLDLLNKINGLRPVTGYVVEKVAQNPLVFDWLLKRLEKEKLLTRNRFNQVLDNPSFVMRGIQLVDEHGLCEFISVQDLIEKAGLCECITRLHLLGLGSKEVYVSLFNAPDIKLQTALLILQGALLKGAEIFQSDEVKLFACEQYRAYSFSPESDTKLLLIGAVRVLSDCDQSSVAYDPALFPRQAPAFELSRLGGLQEYFKTALKLLDISDEQWQSADELGDYASLRKARAEYLASSATAEHRASL